MSLGQKNIDIFSENILYSGVWQKNADNSVTAYWNYSSAEFKTNSKVVTIGYKNTDSAFVEIDGVETKYTVENNELNINTDGELHSIKIIGRYDARITLAYIHLDEDSKFLPPDKRPYFHFIGDSLTHFCTSFSTRTPRALGVDWSVVAQAGASLHDGWGWYPMPEGMKHRRGLESAYLRLQFPAETCKFSDYNFEICRVPDVIVIFLGTNDYLNAETHRKAGHIEIFANAYLNFVSLLREKFPDAKIYMLEGLNDKYCRVEGIETAHKVISAKHKDVHLIRSDKWNIEISEDGTHPTPEGMICLAEKLTEYFKNELKGTIL